MIIELDPKKIAESPSNPRKRGLLDGIDELTESVRAKGLLQPVVVRTKGKGHELVFGHRRRLAAIKAELATIPCIVREFSDDEVLEVQIMENLEREDVHPLDEAEGFAELVRRGRTVQQIAEKVGRPAGFVAQRMKLLDLTEAARTALDTQQITLAVAMVLARVPLSLQEEALEDMIGARDWQSGAPCTVEQALKIVKEGFVLRLALAPFPTEDAKLVKAAGACTACPKRSGAQGVLFQDFAEDDYCLDPACHRKKLDAQWARVQENPPEKYAAVLNDKAGMAALAALNNTYSGTYVRLNEKGDVGGKYNVDIKRLLGKELPPITLARDAKSGQLIDLVKRADVEKIMKAKAAQAAQKKGKAAPTDDEEKYQAELKRSEQKDKAFKGAVRLAVTAVVDKAPAKTKPEVALRLIVMSFAKRAWNDHQKAVLERRGLMPEKTGNWTVQGAIVKLAQELPDVEVAALGLELVANIASPRYERDTEIDDDFEEVEDGDLDIWGQLLDAAGVDFPALQKQCLDELKAKEKEKADKAKERAKKEAAKAAKAEPAASAPAPKGKPTTAKKRAKKTRNVA